jgi:hypothetical protein
MSKDKVVSASGRSGQRAFEIESSTKSAVKAHQDVDVISGRTYAIAGWMMVEASKSGARVEVQWRTNKGKISIQSVGGTITGTNAWAERSALLKAPSNATRARLALFLAKESDGNGRAWFDELSLVRTN